MKFDDLEELNGLSCFLDQINDLMQKPASERWHVKIETQGSGWKKEHEFSDDKFGADFDAFIKQQRAKILKRIEALGVKVAA